MSKKLPQPAPSKNRPVTRAEFEAAVAVLNAHTAILGEGPHSVYARIGRLEAAQRTALETVPARPARLRWLRPRMLVIALAILAAICLLAWASWGRSEDLGELPGAHEAQQTARGVAPPSNAAATLLFFHARWCGPCRSMEPIIAALEREGRLVRTIDVDSEPVEARSYGVSSLPTFIAWREGRGGARITGACSIEDLRRLLDAAASTASPTPTPLPPLASGQTAAICRVSSGGRLGSGTLVYASDGEGVVITALHVIGAPGEATVRFGDGVTAHARWITRDKEGSDLAALLVDVPDDVRPIPVGDVPAQGASVVAAGYGEGPFRATLLVVSETMSSGPGRLDVLDSRGTVRHGDSGGAVLDAGGRLVGVISSRGEEGQTGVPTGDSQFVHAGPIRRFLARLFPRVAERIAALRTKRSAAPPGGGPNISRDIPAPILAPLLPLPVPLTPAPLAGDLAAQLGDLKAANEKILDALHHPPSDPAILAKLAVLGVAAGELKAHQGAIEGVVGDLAKGLPADLAALDAQVKVLGPAIAAGALKAAPVVGLLPGLGPLAYALLLAVGGIAGGAGGATALAKLIQPRPIVAGVTSQQLTQHFQALLTAIGAQQSVAAPSSSIANPPSQIANQPVVVATQSAPPPQSVVNTQSFVPVSVDRHQQAYQWASQQMASKYPGTVQNIESLNSLIAQYLAAQPQS